MIITNLHIIRVHIYTYAALRYNKKNQQQPYKTAESINTHTPHTIHNNNNTKTHTESNTIKIDINRNCNVIIM